MRRPNSTCPQVPPAPRKGAEPELVQSRIVTDDVRRLAAFYARLVRAEVVLNDDYVEVPTGLRRQAAPQRYFTEYHEDKRPAQSAAPTGRKTPAATDANCG